MLPSTYYTGFKNELHKAKWANLIMNQLSYSELEHHLPKKTWYDHRTMDGCKSNLYLLLKG